MKFPTVDSCLNTAKLIIFESRSIGVDFKSFDHHSS
jgi:hypothetical protein